MLQVPSDEEVPVRGEEFMRMVEAIDAQSPQKKIEKALQAVREQPLGKQYIARKARLPSIDVFDYYIRSATIPNGAIPKSWQPRRFWYRAYLERGAPTDSNYQIALLRDNRYFDGDHWSRYVSSAGERDESGCAMLSEIHENAIYLKPPYTLCTVALREIPFPKDGWEKDIVELTERIGVELRTRMGGIIGTLNIRKRDSERSLWACLQKGYRERIAAVVKEAQTTYRRIDAIHMLTMRTVLPHVLGDRPLGTPEEENAYCNSARASIQREIDAVRHAAEICTAQAQPYLR